MKTKLVTSYYPFHTGEPFWGQLNRERWYKYSLANISGMGEIVCYTDPGEKGYDHLVELKETYGLDNLTIKVYDLLQNPYQDRVYKIRMDKADQYNNPQIVGFYIRPTVIYWMKFIFLEMEHEANTNMYWVDAGLSHNGLFPPDASKYHGEALDTEYKMYHFNKAFAPELLERANNYAEGKIINLCRSMTDDNMGDFNRFLNVDTDYQGVYPVGGFFGGKSGLFKQYVDKFKEVAETMLDKNEVCSEQAIMAYINANNRDWFKNWQFDTFCHEGWTNVFQPGQIAFSHFFLKPLQ